MNKFFTSAKKSNEVEVLETPDVEPIEVEDRSVFNCGECEGTGLKGTDRLGSEVVCVACGGTGKN